MKLILLITGCIFFINGCSSNSPSEYRPYASPGGYKDRMISKNHYQVIYHGNENTSQKNVKELWERRALELCPNDYIILKDGIKTDKGIITGRFMSASVYPVFSSIIQCK
jgi:hypothetical protein